MSTVSYKPLYSQVREILQKRIADGVYLQGDLIPSESELAQEFGTSISTIRQAISMLSADGALIKKQGRGTFVSDQKTPIRFFCWLVNKDPKESRRAQQAVLDLIARFEQKHPAIAVECVPTMYHVSKKELLKLITAGNAPDVALIMAHWTSYFASMGAFARLDKLLSKANLASRFHDKDLYGGMYRDKLYSVAWGLCPVTLIANKRVLRNAHIDLPDTPLTLDAFFETCRQLDRFYGRKEMYSYALSASEDKETDFLTIYVFLQAFGGGFMNEQGDIIFNAPETVAAFRWLRQFVHECSVFKADLPMVRKRFAEGQIAFISDGPWVKGHLEELVGDDFDAHFRVLLNPTTPGKASVSWNYNHALAICSQSQYHAQAAKFIDAITTDDELCRFFSTQTGILPVNQRNLDAAGFSSDFFRGCKAQLAHSACINAQNAMFGKAMYFCLNAVHNILEHDADIERELNEKEAYLKMLYEE